MFLKDDGNKGDHFLFFGMSVLCSFIIHQVFKKFFQFLIFVDKLQNIENKVSFDRELTLLIQRIDRSVATLDISTEKRIFLIYVRAAALSMKYSIPDSARQTHFNRTDTLKNAKQNIENSGDSCYPCL